MPRFLTARTVAALAAFVLVGGAVPLARADADDARRAGAPAAAGAPAGDAAVPRTAEEAVTAAAADLTGDIVFSVPSGTFTGAVSVALSTGHRRRGDPLHHRRQPSDRDLHALRRAPLRLTATTQLRAQAFAGGAATGEPGHRALRRPLRRRQPRPAGPGDRRLRPRPSPAGSTSTPPPWCSSRPAASTSFAGTPDARHPGRLPPARAVVGHVREGAVPAGVARQHRRRRRLPAAGHAGRLRLGAARAVHRQGADPRRARLRPRPRPGPADAARSRSSSST